MTKHTVRVIEPALEWEDTGRALLPGLESSAAKVTLKVHEVEAEIISESLIEVLASLAQVVSEIPRVGATRPSKIAFGLGVDASGSVGILSTISGTLSHSASVSVEFEL